MQMQGLCSTGALGRSAPVISCARSVGSSRCWGRLLPCITPLHSDDCPRCMVRVLELWQVHLTITGSLAAPRLRPGLPRSVSSSSFTPGCPYPNALQVK